MRNVFDSTSLKAVQRDDLKERICRREKCDKVINDFISLHGVNKQCVVKATLALHSGGVLFSLYLNKNPSTQSFSSHTPLPVLNVDSS